MASYSGIRRNEIADELARSRGRSFTNIGHSRRRFNGWPKCLSLQGTAPIGMEMLA